MAKIHEEIVVIKLSKLIKDGAVTADIATDDIVNALQQVAEELSDAGVIVEVDRA
jgi:methionine synthase II (cobalamin-independent)